MICETSACHLASLSLSLLLNHVIRTTLVHYVVGSNFDELNGESASNSMHLNICIVSARDSHRIVYIDLDSLLANQSQQGTFVYVNKPLEFIVAKRNVTIHTWSAPQGQ